MEQILGHLTNPAVLAAVGLAIKFVPQVRERIANDVIPLVAALLALIGYQVAPDVAVISAGPLGLHALVSYVHPYGYDGAVASVGLFGFGGVIASSLLQAGQAWFLHKVLGRPFLPKRPETSLRTFRKV